MTYLEKYLKENPNETEDDVLDQRCPTGKFDVDPMMLCGSDDDHNDCIACWNQEYLQPDEEENMTRERAVEIAKEENAKRILDSGDRTQFESGAVRDMREGKGRCDLLPLDVVGQFMEDKILLHVSGFMESGDVGHLYEVMYNTLIIRMFNDRPTMFLEVAKHFEEGAKKYGESNWKRGIPVYCYIDSAIRHYLKFLRGDQDEPHDRAFCWNIMCAIWTCDHKPELNGYAKREVNTEVAKQLG